MATGFELKYKNEKVTVSEHTIGTNKIFRILFADGKHPLIVSKTTSGGSGFFWTSIPEGRQKEAEEIGALISEHFKMK